MSAMIDILEEPRGTQYDELLALATELCGSFSLVWRDQLEHGESAQEIQRSLTSYLVQEKRTDEWPGTQLLGHLATVRQYRVEVGSIQVLKRARGLYSWLAPDYPEDLAFYTPNGAVWLGSIAHEKDAWFAASPGLEAQVTRRIPGLKVSTREDTTNQNG
jgi:hypothetical protein